MADKTDNQTDMESDEDILDELDLTGEDSPPAPQERIIERVEKVVVKRRGFWTMLFAGILVASLGFLVARYDAVAPYVPEEVSQYIPDMPEPLQAIFRGSDIQAPIAANSQTLADLQSRTDALSDELSAKLADTRAELAALSAKVSDAATGVTGTAGEIGALQDELSAVTGRLDAVESGLSALRDDLSPKIDELTGALAALDIPDVTPLNEGLESLKREFAALNDGLREVTAGMTAATQAVETVRTRLDGLDVRVTTLEKRPVQDNLSDDAIAAYERELDAVRRALADERSKIYQKLDEDRGEISRLFELERGKIEKLVEEQRTQMDAVVSEERDKFAAVIDQERSRLDDTVGTQTSRIEALLNDAKSVVSDAFKAADQTRVMQAETAAAKKLAAAQSAVSDIRVALENGGSYAARLADLGDAGVDIPQALSGPAKDGVATQSALATAFPAAARAALAADRSDSPSEPAAGIGGFLKRQLGARSVTPQEGDSTDAILSRAEDALNKGNLSTAVAELQALQGASAAAMADWVKQAQSRLAALDGLNAVAAQLNSN
ncbi:MAG: mitofilin family membrane protein [Marinibacterium sp.]